jgi:hypothetical protein
MNKDAKMTSYCSYRGCQYPINNEWIDEIISVEECVDFLPTGRYRWSDAPATNAKNHLKP